MDRYSRFLRQSSEKLGRFGTLESTARRAALLLFSNDEGSLKRVSRSTGNQREPETRESTSFIRTTIYLEK